VSTVIRLDGQVAIVSGAGRGMGRAHSLELARRGARVVVNDVDAEAAAAVVAEIDAAGGTALACTDSAGTYEGTRAIVDAALGAFGDLDILVNNAGVFPFGYFEELTPEAVRELVDVHLLGSFWLTQHAWPAFRRKGYGRVVMTSSAAGLFANPGLANYAAAKAGVYGLARALSFEGEPHGIMVNVILPAAATRPAAAVHVPGFQEQFGDLDRRLHGRRQPELASHLVAYLASRECAVTGEAFSAVGGRYARVFVGIAEGWLAEDAADVSAEAIRDHLDEIRDAGRFTVAAGSADEIDEVAARLDAMS
jgi:NAD(P)-dependent dehydrogenase (short-subunit alcohol dehydrogenase family)